jgi:putative flippase GtrA
LLRNFISKGFVLKAFKFCLVGGIGYFEGLGLFYILTRYLHVFDLYALTINTLIIAFSNFVGNVLIGNIKLESKKVAD